jgi:hypothetical protein
MMLPKERSSDGVRALAADKLASFRGNGPAVLGAPVHFIYMDEAGTSAKEPVTVVAGVILHGDQWSAAQQSLRETLDEYVPTELRQDFHFHAKEVFSGYRGTSWDRFARQKLIAAVASIPRRSGMAIAFGSMRRTYTPREATGVNTVDFHHAMSFNMCVQRANKYVRDWTPATEMATVVAEDVREKRRLLKAVLRLSYPPIVVQGRVLPTEREVALGRITQTDGGPVDRIIDTVNFAGKHEAPLLQLADACAFVFRRFLSEQSLGLELMTEMLGGPPPSVSDWRGPGSGVCFSFHPERQY